MTSIDWILTAYTTAFCVGGCLAYFLALRTMLRIPRFECQQPAEPATWPSLCVVVPACNEEDTIEAGIQSLLQQDYPGLQIVLVNDRSTDGTGRAVDRAAAADERVQAIHIDKLPEGWLGKVHAMHTGSQAADSDWVLFTDADIQFSPGCLRKAMAITLQDGSVHTAMVPGLAAESAWMQAIMRMFIVSLLQLTRADHARRANSKCFLGVGAFNLLSRDALEKIGGLEKIRMEVADDVGIGTLTMEAGLPKSCLLALKDLKVEIYASVKETFIGFEKNFFGGAAGYSYVRLALCCAAYWLFLAAPLAAFAAVHIPYLWVNGLVALLPLLVDGVFWRVRYNEKIHPSFLIPAGHLILSLVLLRSGWMCYRRGGIMWRGTLYPIEELRKGRILKI